jgi:hypothetical protein
LNHVKHKFKKIFDVIDEPHTIRTITTVLWRIIRFEIIHCLIHPDNIWIVEFVFSRIINFSLFPEREEDTIQGEICFRETQVKTSGTKFSLFPSRKKIQFKAEESKTLNLFSKNSIKLCLHQSRYLFWFL